MVALEQSRQKLPFPSVQRLLAVYVLSDSNAVFAVNRVKDRLGSMRDP